MGEDDIYTGRFNNMIRALEESEYPQDFSMLRYENECGTPACVLGHYAARDDLQDVFSLSGRLRVHWLPGDEYVGCDSDVVLEHFGITEDEAMELFGTDGCNFAGTPEDAIRYLRGFLRRKWPESGQERA